MRFDVLEPICSAEQVQAKPLRLPRDRRPREIRGEHAAELATDPALATHVTREIAMIAMRVRKRSSRGKWRG
jgi:hypothetical protein